MGAFALGGAAALPAAAAPEPTGPGGVGNSALLPVTASVGDEVFATTDVAGLIDPASPSTQHYGPYASESPDSGTCGPDWANDIFDRHFTVHRNPDGTFTVVQQFKDGNFTTTVAPRGPSPGACDTNLDGTVNANISDSMHGYFIIPLPPLTEQTSFDSHCNGMTMTNDPCTTAI